MSDPAVPEDVVALVRSVARDATDDEHAAILASYHALRAAADRLSGVLDEDEDGDGQR